MLVSLFVSFRIYVDDVVILIFECLPGVDHWLHKSVLGDPHQLGVRRRVWIHAEELRVLFDFRLGWLVSTARVSLGIELPGLLLTFKFFLLV